MIDLNYSILINKLRGKMSSNEVIWSKTSSLTQYKLILNNNAVVIDKWFGNDGECVKLEILNQKGVVKSSILYNAKNDYSAFMELSDFYTTVDVYYKQQTFLVITDVINEVSASGVIGKIGNITSDER